MLEVKAVINIDEDMTEALKEYPNFIVMNVLVTHSWLMGDIDLDELKIIMKFLSDKTVMNDEEPFDVAMSLYDKEDLFNDDAPIYVHGEMPKYLDKGVGIMNMSGEKKHFQVLYVAVKDNKTYMSALE